MSLTNLKISRIAIGNKIEQLEIIIIIKIMITRQPVETGLKLKIQLLAEFCHPSCDMNFADPR